MLPLLFFSLDNIAFFPKVKKELSLITNTFGGQTHAWQWDRCRWWGPPPCCLECVVWTGLLSYGSLHPVLRWGALLDNHHQSHLMEENKGIQYNQQQIFYTERNTQICALHMSCCISCLYTFYFTWTIFIFFLLHSPKYLILFLLTRLSLHVDSPCLGELQSSDPSLALYFWVGLQVVGLRPTVGNDKIAWVLHSNIGCGQVDSASACVTHLCLGPGNKQIEGQSNAEFLNVVFYFMKYDNTLNNNDFL